MLTFLIFRWASAADFDWRGGGRRRRRKRGRNFYSSV